MTIGAGGNYGNLKNKLGTEGSNLLNAGTQIDLLSLFIAEEQSLRGVTGCPPNTHDIFDNFPRWIRERNSESNLPEFVQAYYDWLYCKGPLGSQYYVSSENFLDLLNLKVVTTDIIRSYCSSYAADFPSGKIGNSGGNNGITLDNLVNFLDGIRNKFYQTKGTEASYKNLFKNLYGTTLSENSINYPKKRILRLNGGKFSGFSHRVSAGGTGSYEETSTLGGSYLNDGIFQDNYFYQEYSYIIDTGKVSDYDEVLLEMVHPAGLQPFFEQSFADYIPIGGSGDYSEGIADGCESTRLYNYLPYGINATGDLVPCIGCSGSSAGITYFGDRGISAPIFDQPTFNHPGWALAGSTTETIGDIDKYALAFSGVVLSEFFLLCSPAGVSNANSSITSCNKLDCPEPSY